MNPSDFLNFPYDSILQKNEYETAARNIMKILARTGNTFRELTWTEYMLERGKDGGNATNERKYFDTVKWVGFCESNARNFSPSWAEV